VVEHGVEQFVLGVVRDAHVVLLVPPGPTIAGPGVSVSAVV
jgi:hypothetical protein